MYVRTTLPFIPRKKDTKNIANKRRMDHDALLPNSGNRFPSKKEDLPFAEIFPIFPGKTIRAKRAAIRGTGGLLAEEEGCAYVVASFSPLLCQQFGKKSVLPFLGIVIKEN